MSAPGHAIILKEQLFRGPRMFLGKKVFYGPPLQVGPIANVKLLFPIDGHLAQSAIY